jgi:hypothetical protein
MESISPQQLRHFFAATGDELVKLRCLVDPDDDGNFPQATACRTLLAIRQGSRRRDPITEQWRAGQPQPARQAAPSGLLAKLRRGMNRRVPPQ